VDRTKARPRYAYLPFGAGIDPELRIRARPPVVLRRTTEAVDFIRKVAVVTPDRVWQDLLQSFEAAHKNYLLL
jgi:hypothetical protein